MCWSQWLRGPGRVLSSVFRNLVSWLLVLVGLWIYIYSSFYVVLLRKRSAWDWLILHVRNTKKYLLIVFLKPKKTENIRIKVRFGRVHVNVFAAKKLYILSVCVCVCVCVCVRMDRVVLSLVTCLAVPYFSALSHKRHYFLEKFRQQKCVFWISVQLFLPLLILRRIERYIIINVHTSSYKVLVFLVGF